MYRSKMGCDLYRSKDFLRIRHFIFATKGRPLSSNQITALIVRVVPMVMLLEMILGTAVLLFALYARTSAYVSTCTQLSWESKAERENFTLYNAGNVSNGTVCLFA